MTPSVTLTAPGSCQWPYPVLPTLPSPHLAAWGCLALIEPGHPHTCLLPRVTIPPVPNPSLECLVAHTAHPLPTSPSGRVWTPGGKTCPARAGGVTCMMGWGPGSPLLGHLCPLLWSEGQGPSVSLAPQEMGSAQQDPQETGPGTGIRCVGGSHSTFWPQFP